MNQLQTAVQIAAAVRSRQVSATEVLERYLDRIPSANRDLNAFVHLDLQAARAAARGIDESIGRGIDPGPLAGVPIGVKDTEDCAGMPTTHGSTFYQGNPPAAVDSALVARVRSAGAIPIGKTAVPEFALHAITWSRAFGTTRNPWDPTQTPGGSSGGSAAAVAAGMVPLASATDAGGSTRSPAAFTGLVGLKPSHGRIGQEVASDLQAKGCLSLTVADTARFLDVTAGPIGVDRTSLPRPDVRYEDAIERLDVTGLRVAWSDDLGFIPTDPDVVAVAHRAALTLADSARLGWVDRRLEIPNPLPGWGPAILLQMRGELELDGIWPARLDQMSPRARTRLAAMDGVGAVAVARAARLRAEVAAKAAAFFDDVDVLLTPATAVVSLPADGPAFDVLLQQNPNVGLAEAHLALANMTWQPAISVPAGFDPRGFPIGLQIVCRRSRDDVALRLARILEDVAPWPLLAPAYR